MPKTSLGLLARRAGAFDALDPLRTERIYREWLAKGRPLPAPPAAKRVTLRSYAEAYGLRTLVETGTFRADTVRTLRHDFDLIHSIEIDDSLYADAVKRCAGQANARLHRGDSATVIGPILDKLIDPALFWLDAHYSGAGTGGHHHHPTAEEVRKVTERRAGHVVLVDDVRCFGTADYPPIEIIKEIALAAGYRCEVRDDVARLTPEP